MILGPDFLTTAGITLDFESGVVQWLGQTVVRKEEAEIKSSWNSLLDVLTDELKDESYILDADYVTTSALEITGTQQHLNKQQHDQLEEVLQG